MSRAISFEDVFPASICEVQGAPFIFTNLRVKRETVPRYMHVYDVRDDCDGEFWQIQPQVLINHWGTIIGFESLKLDDKNQYWCPPSRVIPGISSEGNMIGSASSFDEFKKQYRQDNRKEEKGSCAKR